MIKDKEADGVNYDKIDVGVLHSDNINAGHLVDGAVEGSRIESESPLHGLPTQVVHPWRTVARTAIQHVSGVIVTGVVWLFASIGIDISELSSDLVISVSVVLSLLFTGLVARVMSSSKVENFLVKWLTPLATGVSEENKSPAAKQ